MQALCGNLPRDASRPRDQVVGQFAAVGVMAEGHSERPHFRGDESSYAAGKILRARGGDAQDDPTPPE